MLLFRKEQSPVQMEKLWHLVSTQLLFCLTADLYIYLNVFLLLLLYSRALYCFFKKGFLDSLQVILLTNVPKYVVGVSGNLI